MKSSIIADKEKIDIIERDIPHSDGHKVVIKVAYAGYADLISTIGITVTHGQRAGSWVMNLRDTWKTLVTGKI